MNYVSLDMNDVVSNDGFFTFFDLVQLCTQYPDHTFKFIGTNYSPCTIISWRGSYDLPAILATEQEITGNDLCDMIYKELDEIHEGYKGGEYTYNLHDEFYVTLCPSVSSEHAVDGYHVDGNIVWLNTNINPY